MALGRKTGGRQKGVTNKVTVAKAKAIAASGLTPLDYMMSLLRDTSQPQATRLDAAKSAAPYVHSKLATIDAFVSADVGITVEIVRFGKPE